MKTADIASTLLKSSVVVVGVLANLWGPIALGSDHIDGPVTAAADVKDISDLFVFKTPGDPSSLSVVLDVRPFALSWNHFDTKVVYKIHLRKAMLNYASHAIDTDAASEAVVTCSFNSPDSSQLIQASCATNSGMKSVANFNAMDFDKQLGNSFKLYAGFRADPFFIDKDFFIAYTDQLQIPKKNPSNIMTQLNVLTLVMDLPINSLFPPGSASTKPAPHEKEVASKTAPATPKRTTASQGSYLIAVSAESRSTVPDQVWDVVGRPEITNLTMHARKGMQDVRDVYNRLEPFRMGPAAQPFFQRMHDNIHTYDMIDGHQDLTEPQLTSLANLLVNDFVTIDPFNPNCAHSSYFELERAVLLGQSPVGCGGRDMNDSVVNVLYTIYTKGLTPAGSVSDGVNAPEKPISPQFPYLAEPTTGAAAYLKANVARLL